MNPMTIKFKFKRKSKTVPVNETKEERKKRLNRERVARSREKLKADPKRYKKHKRTRKTQNALFLENQREKRSADSGYDVKKKRYDKYRKRGQRAKNKRARKSQENSKAACSQPITTNDAKARPSRTPKRSEGARIRKAASRSNLPNSPYTWTKTVNHLVSNATPNRRAALNHENVFFNPENSNKSTGSNATPNRRAALHRENVFFNPENSRKSTESAEERPILKIVKKRGRPRKSESCAKKLFYCDPTTKKDVSRKARTQYQRRMDAEKRETTAEIKKMWKKEIRKFLENNDISREMPNKRDTMKIKGKWKAKRHLLMPYKEAFRKFLKQSNGYPYKYTTFRDSIPKYIQRMRLWHRRVCICMKHHNTEQKIKALNKLTGRNQGVMDIVKSTVCDYTDRPSKKCFDRKCDECGPEKINVIPIVAGSVNRKAKWYEWKKVNNEWKKITHHDTIDELIEKLKIDMEAFAKHVFTQYHQNQVMKDIIDNLPLDQAFALMDFAMKFEILYQDEIEPAHFSPKGVTIFPVFLVRHAVGSTTEKRKLSKECLIMISDQKEQNCRAVLAFTRQTLMHMKYNPTNVDHVKKLHRMSDNCACQFKCAEAFSHMDDIRREYDCEIEYHYSEPEHGKAQSDGIGATAKQCLSQEILFERAVINNPYEAYRLLSQKLTTNKRKVYYVPKRSIKTQKRKLRSVPGTQRFRHVKLNPDGTFTSREMGCGLPCCITNNESNIPCTNADYAMTLKTFRIPGVQPLQCILLKSMQPKRQPINYVIPEVVNFDPPQTP